MAKKKPKSKRGPHKTSDAQAVAVEIRAAALAFGGRSRRMERYGMTVHSLDCEGILDEEPIYPARHRADIDAGWLCREIATHDAQQTEARIAEQTRHDIAASAARHSGLAVTAIDHLREHGAPLLSRDSLGYLAECPCGSAWSVTQKAFESAFAARGIPLGVEGQPHPPEEPGDTQCPVAIGTAPELRFAAPSPPAAEEPSTQIEARGPEIAEGLLPPVPRLPRAAAGVAEIEDVALEDKGRKH
jgi:hypothetical protein